MGSHGKSLSGEVLLQSRGRAKQSRTVVPTARTVMLSHPSQQGQLMQSHCHVLWPHKHLCPQGLPDTQASFGAFILMSTTWLFFLQP